MYADVGIEGSCVYFDSHLFCLGFLCFGGLFRTFLISFQVLESLVDPGVELKGREGNVCN